MVIYWLCDCLGTVTGSAKLERACAVRARLHAAEGRAARQDADQGRRYNETKVETDQSTSNIQVD